MNIEIQRKFKKPNYTIGSLSLPLGGDGEGSFFCNTLEPPIGTEIESRTAGSNKAIPPGTYNIRMTWSPKFKQKLPLLECRPSKSPCLGGLPDEQGDQATANIPPKQGGLEGLGTRSGILIHSGNSVRDSTGCILVGKNTQVGKVLQSRATLNALVDKINTALANGESIQVVIK